LAPGLTSWERTTAMGASLPPVLTSVDSELPRTSDQITLIKGC
jgi:hypothetical protein